MRIRYYYNGQEKTFETEKTLIVVGRPDSDKQVAVDLDLSPDKTVSRPHARIGFEEGRFWIEDRGSTRGTKLDDKQIKGLGRVPLVERHPVLIGSTTLFVDPIEMIDDATISSIVQAKEPPPLGTAAASDETDSVTTAPLDDGMDVPFSAGSAPANRYYRLLHELLFQFGTDAKLDKLLQFAVERLLAAVPIAERGALLFKDSMTGSWLLKAHHPGKPAVSIRLAEHALQCGGGFVWRRGTDPQISVEIASGIYAPLVWRGESYGVLCVDNHNGLSDFSSADLELVVTAAQHIAMAIANYRLREDLRRNAALVERLLTNFSPSIRKKLLEKAKNGRLRLGGEKSEVTILSSDIRGFTSKSAEMDAEDVVDMLNDYFSALVSAVFRHDGTVDKFVGDAILAVFGSPERDPDQHAKAVQAALAMQAAIGEVNKKRAAKGLMTCEMGIGVHCGEVLHGFIGSEERMEFTVIGDAVNRASRYCDGAGAGQVLISPELYERVWQIVDTTAATVKTKHEGELPAYRLDSLRLGMKSTLIEPVPRTAVQT